MYGYLDVQTHRKHKSIFKNYFQKSSVEEFCPDTLEIKYNGNKWETLFPDRRVSNTAMAKLNFVGEYNEAETISALYSFSINTFISYTFLSH